MRTCDQALAGGTTHGTSASRLWQRCRFTCGDLPPYCGNLKDVV